MSEENSNITPEVLESLLCRSTKDNRFVVVMTCGIAGSGKTTLAKAILKDFPFFRRLSVDELVGEAHGLYGIDYAADEELYATYLQEADTIFENKFKDFLEVKQDMVLDRSFYAKIDRDWYKSRVEEAGGRAVLVYFHPTQKELLWERIQRRYEEGKDANSAFKISRKMFEKYWDGFDIPLNEGEVVLSVA